MLRGLVFAGVIAASASVVFAQAGGAQGEKKEAPAVGSANVGKVAVIAARQAIASTAEGKQASAELQSQFAPRQTELEGLQKQLQDLQQRLSAGQGKLSQEEGVRLQRQAEIIQRQGQRKNQEYQDDLNEAQAEVFDRIGRKMLDVLDRYCRENGFTVALDSSAQNTPILFASTNIDVTQEIVRLYDQQYPVKAQTPAKPAASKPPAKD